MTPSWDLVRSFLAVLDEGSLSAAGRRLRLTQPTIGRHIAELEAELGVVLFTRTPSGLDPTEAANELRPHAEAMAGAATALIRAASGEAMDDRGTVRITASEIVGIEILPSILTQFQRLHPRIAIELVVSNRNEDLLRRSADIAVRMVPPTQSALLQRKLGVIDIGFHARRDYLEQFGTPATMEDLAKHSVIGFDEETPVIQALQRQGLLLTREIFSLRTDSDITHLAAIRAGFGIGACQARLAARDPQLVRILAESFSFPLECWLAMHEDLKGVRRMRLVFDHLAEGLSAYIAGRDTWDVEAAPR